MTAPTIRLDRLLTNRGYCSRSEVTDLIRDSRILVNGRSPSGPSEKVDPNLVTFDEEPLDPAQGLIVMLYKPCNYICSHKEMGQLVFELLPPRFSHRKPPLACVGRLDKDTSGLLLLTDNGQLLHRLTSPKHKVKKVYEVMLEQPLTGHEKELFESGTLVLKDESTPLKPAFLEAQEDKRAFITLYEGRYHQVRRMFAAVGNHVIALKRVQFGSLGLGDLQTGGFRIISEAEISS